MNNEHDAAINLQQRWRNRQTLRMVIAAIRIQSKIKDRHERARVEAAQLEAAEELTRRKAEKAQLMCECSAILEKQCRSWKVGQWELTTWQHRHVFVNERSLVYQHVKANSEPTGSQKEVPFRAMEVVKVLVNDQVLIKCKGPTARTYLFQLGNREEAERWATNIVRLAADMGQHVPGVVATCVPSKAASDERSRRDERGG